MLKSFICFLGLCSCLHAANIDIVEVPQGGERFFKTTSVVISSTLSNKERVMEILKYPSVPWSTHLYVCSDGGVTCFVPNDAQLANRKKFPFKAVAISRMRDGIKDINDGDYARLANYLMHSCYTTRLCGAKSGWRGKAGCDNFSINIMLERRGYTTNRDLLLKGGYTYMSLYTNTQIDVVHDVLLALVNKGISKKNILGLSDIGLSVVHIAPYTSFWRQFNDRHKGFFPAPYKSATHNISGATKLKKALLRIGYTNPKNPKTNAKFIGEDCWVRRAVNAFILHYLPREMLRFGSLDGKVVTVESVYPPADMCYSKELTYKILRDSYPYILSAIDQISNT